MTSSREHCVSLLLGYIEAGRWNVIKIQKLRAIKLHKNDDKKKKSTPLRDATASVDAKKFPWHQKRNEPTQNENKLILSHRR